MTKNLGLDLGDKWVGMATSDALGISCKPYKTVPLPQLFSALKELFAAENIGTVVVGCPTTFAGTQSEQTKRIIGQKEELEKNCATLPNAPTQWVLWDERLSSKRASMREKKKDFSKEAKQHEHAVAAAFILQSYLDSRAFNQQ